MKIERHGISIGIDRVENRFYISIKAIGKLTHDDYEKMTPMIDAALSSVDTPHVDVLLDATEMEGWEIRAAWDDFKLGLKHGSDFNRIAILGHKRWQEMTAKVANWFISGEVKFFEQRDDAIKWIHGIEKP